MGSVQVHLCGVGKMGGTLGWGIILLSEFNAGSYLISFICTLVSRLECSPSGGQFFLKIVSFIYPNFSEFFKSLIPVYYNILLV